MTKETAFHPRTSALTGDMVEYRGYWLPDRLLARAAARSPSTGHAARRR